MPFWMDWMRSETCAPVIYTQDGKLTWLEARRVIRQAEVDMKRLSYEAWILNQACDTMAALSAAIDFHRLKVA